MATKPKPPPITKGEIHAKIDGIVAGLRDSLSRASGGIIETRKRCELAQAFEGVLTGAQLNRLADMAEEMATILPTIKACQDDVEIAIKSNLKPRKVELDLM